MNQPLHLLPTCAWLVGLAALLNLFNSATAAWWEHAHDTWYFKDDWKAAQVRNYAFTLHLQSPATNGWIVIWGDQGVTLRVNGVAVMKHVDRGLIYDTNLTASIKGTSEVKLESGPGGIVAEGEIYDSQGRQYPFASGCDWPSPAPAGANLPAAARPYRPGDASGAFNSAHNGRLIRYNDEERGKADISKGLARLQKLRDQSIFLLRRFRSAEEILSFSPGTLWRRAENFAAGPMAEAEKILKEQAIPAQKRGAFTNASALAAKAGSLLASAEQAINVARELEEAERHAQHLMACVDLMASRGTNVPTLEQEFTAARAQMSVARREAGANNWTSVQRKVTAAQKTLAALDVRLSQLWGSPVGKLDEFPEDRFGWLNAQVLMGNDPAQWEFSIVNPDANWIDLSGVWAFRTDPPNKGEDLGWHKPGAPHDKWRTVRVPGQWEREGVLEDNDYSPWDCPYKLGDLRCEDKPYNGYAWYRREVHVPQSWSARRVVLRVEKVSNWLHVFLNGKPVSEPRRDGGSFSLPNDLLKPGENNTIAIQVYNHDNFGGITGGPVALAVEDAKPEIVVTPGPLSFTTETAVKIPTGTEHTVAFASAMIPAVILAGNQPAVHLWGWEAKGFSPPQKISFQATNGAQEIALPKGELTIAGETLSHSWLRLSGGVKDQQLAQASPLVLVLEQRPKNIRWSTNALGFAELTLTFATNGSLMVVLCLGTEQPEWDATTCNKRVREFRAVPVACSELAQIDPQSLRGSFLMRYQYLEIPDFTGEESENLAPLPLLFSYAIEHRFPDLNSPNATEEIGRFQGLASYRVWSSDVIVYHTPLLDKSKLLKGVGELFAKRQPAFNARGGNTEQQMFDDWKEWGFDHCRYAFAWGAPWDLPLQKFVGGSITDDPALWARLDSLVKQHTDRGLMAMLCYFFNEDSPQRDSKNLMRNSTRYWRMHPEVRTNCYELWRRIADRYKDLPAPAVAYDFFNEPAYMHREDWNRILKDLTQIIRSVDPKHLIVCEAGDGWSQPQWFHWVQPTGDTNTIYSFHHYGKHWGYDRDEYYPSYSWPPEKENDNLLEVILFGLRHHVPLHCGEFGVSMISPGEDHLVWLDDYLARFERFGIGWNWWNWSGADIYRTGLKAGDELSPNLSVLRQWIERKKSWR